MVIRMLTEVLLIILPREQLQDNTTVEYAVVIRRCQRICLRL